MSVRVKQQAVKTGIKALSKVNFVSVSFAAIMMKLGQLIDFDKKKIGFIVFA